MSDDLELPEYIKELLKKKTMIVIQEAEKRGIKNGDVKLFCLIYSYFDDFADCVIQDCKPSGLPEGLRNSGEVEVEYRVSESEHNHRVAELSAELLLKLKELMTI